MAPPTVEYITEFFNSVFGGALVQKKALSKYIATDFSATITGREFVLSGEDYDLNSLMTDVVDPVVGAIDTSKSSKFALIRVIGGTGPWVAIEIKATATSKKGKPWVHEFVILASFNDDGKITELKGFADTQHLHNHVVNGSA